MKRRACQFGESGGADLLRRLQSAAPEDRHVRFHLMGHSFGCIVVSASIAGDAQSAARPVDTLVLVQGALSLWSYCASIPSAPERPGYFHRIVADNLVRGPMVTTMSEHDRAVGFFYPLGAVAGRQLSYRAGQFPTYGGLGAFGARGLPTAEDLRLRGVSEQYDFRPGRIYNLESSHVIATGGGASGAHNDICHPEVAHAVWSAIATTIES
jgi:pimeloyl-ACP methyl ester carboxylesterase